MVKCKCGCGGEVKPRRQFIHGHWAKTPEAKEILIKTHKGRKNSKESIEKNRKITTESWKIPSIRKKRCNGMKKNWEDPIFREKHSEGMKKFWENVPLEHIEKMRQRMIGDKNIAKKPEIRKKISESKKEYYKNGMPNEHIKNLRKACKKTDHCKKISDALTGRIISKEWRKKISEGKKGALSLASIEKARAIAIELWKDPLYRGKITKAQKKGWDAPGKRKKRGELKKTHWKDPIYRENNIRATIKANQKRPTHPEKRVKKLLDLIYPKKYLYNGNKGDIIIGGRCPDFVNCNGEKKVIEVNGIYWHLWKIQKDRNNPNLTKEMIEAEERKPYEKFGFKVLFIWEDELENEEKAIEKIKGFENV